MSDRVRTWLLVGATLWLLCGGLGLLTIQVSLKYEVGDAPCLSVVSGRNLCADYELAKWLSLATLGTLGVLIGFSNQLIRKK